MNILLAKVVRMYFVCKRTSIFHAHKQNKRDHIIWSRLLLGFDGIEYYRFALTPTTRESLGFIRAIFSNDKSRIRIFSP